jgi:TPR repeat protein
VWFAEAAEAGHPEAAYKLGVMFRDSRRPDYAKAAHYFRLAADLGYTGAARALAEIVV